MLRRKLAAVLAASALTVAGVALAVPATGASAAVTVAPIRASFLYDWFPETENWSSQYTPTLGKYDSSNQTIMAAHIGMAKYAGLDAFITSWWGQGTPTDKRLAPELAAAAAQGFHVTPYYEKEGNGTPPTDAQFGADLTYLAGLSSSPAWLKVNGKPVLFIYNALASESTCATVARLESINAGRFYINAKVFAGYTACAVQPESWHQYGPAAHYDRQGTYSAAVSPGFFKFNETTPRLVRDVARFKTDLATQVASAAQWQLTTTFNEWGEGTAVEPAAPWQSTSGYGDYLDAMRAAYTGTQPPTTTTTPTPTTPPVSSTPSTPTSTVDTTTPVSSTSASTPASSTPVSTTAPTTPTTPTTPTSTTVPTTPTTTTTTQPVGNVTKVLAIIEENHSLAQMQAGMPYLYSQAQKYGYATNYTAIRHPSLPNYLAIAGGSTFGVTDDGSVAAHPIAGPSIFGAAITAGKTAKSYQESMTGNCPTAQSQGPYVSKHNPWAYFTQEKAVCAQFDVPSGTSAAGNLHNDIVAGTLPNVGEVTPNLNNDAHDGSLATADAWLHNWLTLIYASPDWLSGHLAVIVLADEDNNTSTNKVLTTVIHPSQSAHVVTTALTHYSLTGLFTQLAGAPCINAGCSAPNFASAFGLTL